MYCVLLAQISIPPADALSIPIDTPSNVGVVVFVTDPMHEMAPHYILLVVSVELLTDNEGDTCPFACMFKSLCA